jgi:hypothetical protein
MENNNRIKNQVFSQIIFPMICFILIVVASSYFLFINLFSGKMDFRVWSDISVLVVILPVILSFVFTFIFIAGLIYVISLFQPKLNNALIKVNSIVKSISFWTIKSTDLISQPVIHLETFISQIFSLFNIKEQD